jgi:hypothetical protein
MTLSERFFVSHKSYLAASECFDDIAARH